jgi:hypothetical protein
MCRMWPDRDDVSRAFWLNLAVLVAMLALIVAGTILAWQAAQADLTGDLHGRLDLIEMHDG